MIKYPIYVISKGRWDLAGHTAHFLKRDGVVFKLVIEPQEEENYLKFFDKENILILPFSNLGLGGIPARNWCWEHSISIGAKRHWIIDDNIYRMMTWVKGKRTECNSYEAFEKIEQFTDRFSNIGIAGINYSMNGVAASVSKNYPPFYLNHHVYSCLLILNELTFRWRGRYNEDTDLCLQALTRNLCTVNFNTYFIVKRATMTCKGGNTDELYKGNGRLKMARSLELQWAYRYPGLVKTIWRFGRPQHYVKWKTFKTPLKLIETNKETPPKESSI